MTTTVVKTIGSGGDYSTLQGWEDAAPANLVTSDQVWQGQMISAATNLSGSGTLLTIGGSTSDATRYKELTAATGASFVDNASAQSNALRWNSSNGCSISGGDNYSAVIVITEAYARLSRLQVAGSGTQASAVNISGGSDQVLSQSIFEATGLDTTHGVLTSNRTAGVFKNCLFVRRVSGGSALILQGNIGLYNCTIVKPSDIGAVTNGISMTYPSGSSTVKNTAIFGFTAAASTGAATITYTTCRTDQSSPPSGFTQITYDTSTGSGFQNITDSTRDFRIKSTSAMKDNGTTDSTNAATDIVGTSRPQVSSYDIGAWEYMVPAVTAVASRKLLLGVGA